MDIASDIKAMIDAALGLLARPVAVGHEHRDDRHADQQGTGHRPSPGRGEGSAAARALAALGDLRRARLGL